MPSALRRFALGPAHLPARYCDRLPLLLALAGALAGGLGAAVSPARAEYRGNLSTQEQTIYDYGPNGSNGSSKGGSILDSTNPIDLMNKIRRGTALDDATDPGDAIDAALKELEVQSPTATQPLQAP